MGRFRSAKSQARHAVSKKLALGKPSHGEAGDDGKIHSLGTANTYSQSLKGVAEFIAANRLDPQGKGIDSLTAEIAGFYLEFRSQEVGQKQLDKDRQAIQLLLGEKLPVIKSELEQALESRAYTQIQIELIAGAQTRKNSLATSIAANAGLRAHELYTLAPKGVRTASAHRDWTTDRFAGRQDVVIYTVKGKGGLIREVALDKNLSDTLEKYRLDSPRNVTDRGIFIEQYYDLGGGKKWSDSFSKAAQRELGWSSGAHGVRHTFAQARMLKLQSIGYGYEQALGIVSQEMGHFRPSITEVYLR
jgi:integrase